MRSASRTVAASVLLLACSGSPVVAPRAPATKRIVAEGIPVSAHAAVPDEALAAAGARLARMVARAPRVRANLQARGLEIFVAGRFELVTDLAPFAELKGTLTAWGEDIDEHTRGVGHQYGRFVACAEGNLLGDTGNRQFRHDICIHDLAHAVDELALGGRMRGRLVSTFQASRDRWTGAYAARNHAEYFAELAMWYFGSSSGSVPTKDARPGPEWLRGYDPEGYALLDAIFSGREDPGPATRVPLALRDPAREAEMRSPPGGATVVFELRNATAGPLETFWLDGEGRRTQRAVVPAGRTAIRLTYAGHVFVVAEPSGKAVAIVVAAEADGAAEIR